MKKLGLGILSLAWLVSCSGSDASIFDSSLASDSLGDNESVAQNAQALGTPIILVDGVSPESIAVSGSAVFFINQIATGNQVVKAATDSPATSVIASYSKFASSIVADASSVYWTVPYTIYDDKTNGGVWTRAVTGGTPRRIAEWYVRSTCVQA